MLHIVPHQLANIPLIVVTAHIFVNTSTIIEYRFYIYAEFNMI